MSSVAIGNGTTNIGPGAFSGCSRLTGVTIPNSVTSIGDGVFSYCPRLTSVTIPNSVTSIGYGVFSYCTYLTEITVAALNANYCSVDGVLFDKRQITLIQCPGGKAGSVTVPGTVTKIAASAFIHCSKLSSITIPNSVTNIGGGAFDHCSGLSSITIPNSVTSLGDGAFSDCGGLSSVAIGNNVTGLGFHSFYYCFRLTNITIGNSVTSIGDSAFFNCGLRTLSIPNSVRSIERDAFSSCSGLVSVTFGNSVTSIGDFAFIGCYGLTSVAIPNSVTNIGYGAFQYCSSLTSVSIPSNLTTVGNQAFYGCNSLQGVYFQGNAPSLGGSSVFDYANSATVYYLPGTTGWGATFGGRPTQLWYPGAPAITAHPQSQAVQTGGAVSFNVGASGGFLSYQWQLNGTNLADGGTISGVTTTNLTIYSVQTNHAGSYSVVVTSSVGSATSRVAVLTVIKPPSLASALGDPGLVWTTGGTAPWFPQSTTTHDGVAAAQSGLITHSQDSWMQTSLVGPGTLIYWWKVSSESGYDYLEFYLDGVLQSGRISGTVDWQKKTNSIAAGAHTVKWRYIKDYMVSSGQDAGWVDQVSYTGTASLRFETSNGSLSVSNGVCNLRLTGTAGTSVVLERSSGLTTWTPFQTNTLPAGGLPLAIPTANYPQQFFRARQVTSLP
jgi:hypothetical protein